jgi:protein-S-isoprenylcysteine O-methyltransferase Ste14
VDFSNPLIRFATSGLLIAFYGLVDHLSRRNGGELRRQGVRPPRALTIVVTCCVLAYYMMIRPYGGPLLGGLGNMIGIALACTAMAIRFATRNGLASVRQPDVAARVLFYVALPLAVGVPAGWLVLTLPAVITSAWWSRREDALLIDKLGEPWRERVATSAHWAPNVW